MGSQLGRIVPCFRPLRASGAKQADVALGREEALWLAALDALGGAGWLKALRLEGYAPRSPRRPGGCSQRCLPPRGLGLRRRASGAGAPQDGVGERTMPGASPRSACPAMTSCMRPSRAPDNLPLLIARFLRLSTHVPLLDNTTFRPPSIPFATPRPATANAPVLKGESMPQGRVPHQPGAGSGAQPPGWLLRASQELCI